MAVHSQGSCGSIVYMYIICCRPQGSSSHKWFRFDDGEVVEAKIDDEEVCVCMCAD